jgi:hypothetical protein
MRCFIFFIVPLILTGCGTSARYVVKENDGGIVSIPSNSNSWPGYNRREAEKLMMNHFPDGYEVVREEEAVVGQTSSTNVQESRSPIVVGNKAIPGLETTSTNATTSVRDHTEWRIYYRHKQGFNVTKSPVHEGTVDAGGVERVGVDFEKSKPTIERVKFEASSEMPLPDPVK